MGYYKSKSLLLIQPDLKTSSWSQVVSNEQLKTSTTSSLELCPDFMEFSVMGQGSFPFHVSQTLSVEKSKSRGGRSNFKFKKKLEM